MEVKQKTLATLEINALTRKKLLNLGPQSVFKGKNILQIAYYIQGQYFLPKIRT